MNLNMIRPKNETENLLLSITKNCETLIEQTRRKTEETLEFKLTKPRETFHFDKLIQIKGDWMIGLTNLEVRTILYLTSTQQITNSNFIQTLDEFSFEELKDEVEEFLDISNITDDHLEDKTIGPRIIKAYWKLRSEKSSTDGYILLLMAYARSPFRHFESYLRIVIGLDEDDIRLILKQYNEKFITYDLSPGLSSSNQSTLRGTPKKPGKS